jgi:hypothetical protein
VQIIPYRMLRNRPGEVRRLLEQEGELVVTSNNQPFALMLEVQPDELEDLLLLARRLRAQKAVSAARAEAREHGLNQLGAETIEAEIAAAHSTRRPGKHDA